MQKLLFLLPFYVIRYEKSREDIEKDPEKLQKLLDEYVTISRRLEESLLENGKEALHRYLVEVIIKIADYIFSDSEKTKKGVDRAMGGEVLELKTDKLINEIRQDVKEEVKEEIKKDSWEDDDIINDILEKRISQESDQIKLSWMKQEDDKDLGNER